MRREAIMRLWAILLAIVAIGLAFEASARERTRLAQSSSLTNCMMTCNAQFATCDTTCLVPGSAPTGAATTGGNANINATCQANCSITRLSCQTTCAQSFPPQ
jgi:hypothetical protein